MAGALRCSLRSQWRPDISDCLKTDFGFLLVGWYGLRIVPPGLGELVGWLLDTQILGFVHGLYLVPPSSGGTDASDALR